MIFDGDKETFMTMRESAVQWIAEIEIPTCLNLAHCYNKIGEYQHAIKYAS
jgi:hypothetical protein